MASTFTNADLTQEGKSRIIIDATLWPLLLRTGGMVNVEGNT
ncbi:MAG TPA: hypothetical protein VN476_09325 [Pyrinomonadaceae bacterium]|nr:hypothetical protein [Pyrinomonadaceae bacterium]